MRRDQADTFRDVEPPRPLNEWERAAISLILDLGGVEADAARVQLSGARVRAECTHCPSVDFEIDPTAPLILGPAGTRSSGALSDMHGTDVDGMFVEIVLIYHEGRVTAMDVWRGDGERFAPPPLEGFG